MGTELLTLDVPVSNEAATVARRAMASALLGRTDEGTIAVAQLVASELIGGVLRCDPRPSVPLRVTADRHESTLRVTVQDEGPMRRSPFELPDDGSPDGVGGRLLRDHSESWGFVRINGTTIAWSEFPVVAAEASRPR